MQLILRVFCLTTLLFWFLLTIVLWQFHKPFLSSLVPQRIPWISSQNLPPDGSKMYLSDGHWVRSPARMNDMLIWGQKYPNDECLGPSALVKGQVRSQDVDGWEWVLDSGNGKTKGLANFDIEQFVVRGLQSRIGYILVGDSLTEGITAALEMMLLMPNPLEGPKLISRTWEHGPVRWKHANGPVPWLSNMTLSPHHPLTQRIMKRLESGEDEELRNVPPERIRRPIVRQFRSSNLATEEESSEVIIQDMGVNVDWTEQLRIPTPWRERLRMHAEEQGWEGEKPALALINTGAHWEPDRFQPISEVQMMEAYKLVMKKVYDSFLSFPSDLPLRVMYRSTMPGHENCHKYHYPVTYFDQASQDPTGERNRTYHWHWFPEYNEFARELWGSGALSLGDLSNRGEEVLERGVSSTTEREPSTVITEYWDIWNMSATRPDAHIAWNGHFVDCLHWCPAGMYEWVIRAWWHTIATEGY